MNNNLKEIFEANEKYAELKTQVSEKILKADSGYDNKILSKIYDEAIKRGNVDLAKELHTAMYDNRAVNRVKSAERVSSSLGEWFDKSAFEEKIKNEGDVKERPLEMQKSEAFKDAPYFTVGLHPSNINEPDVKADYLKRVETLTKDMQFQLSFAENREFHMNKTLSAAKEFFGEDLYAKFKNEPVAKNETSIKSVLELEEKYREVRNEVSNKILSPNSGYDNKILKKIYDETLDKGNPELTRQLHEVMYDNRASQRIKQAERVSSSLGEPFNRNAFEDKVRNEGDAVEKPNVVEKSIVFKDAPHFTVGMRSINVGKDEKETQEYSGKVVQLTKEMQYQLDFANNRESKMVKTLEAVKKFFGEDLYKKFSNGQTFANKLGDALIGKNKEKPEVSNKNQLKM